MGIALEHMRRSALDLMMWSQVQSVTLAASASTLKHAGSVQALTQDAVSHDQQHNNCPSVHTSSCTVRVQ